MTTTRWAGLPKKQAAIFSAAWRLMLATALRQIESGE